MQRTALPRRPHSTVSSGSHPCRRGGQQSKQRYKCEASINLRPRRSHRVELYEAQRSAKSVKAGNRARARELTPFGTIYRYEDYDAPVSLDRTAAREILRQLRLWWTVG